MAKKQRQRGCACGSGLSRAQCCGRFVDGHADAPTAEALMRSRYTAFAEQNADYLLATWHPEHRPSELHFAPELRWLGLQILHCEQGQPGDQQGVVEFIARAKHPAQPAHRQQERSYFSFSDGRWWYCTGTVIEA